MPRFKEALTALTAGFPDADENTWGDISAAYDEDLAEAATGAEAVIAELTAQLDATSAQLTEAQADNYRLLKASGVSMEAAENEPPADEGEDDTDEFESPADDFFTEDEEEK